MDLFDLQVGDKLRYFYSEGNINNCLKHVRGYVDGHLILRRWSKRRQSWSYEVEPIWSIEISKEYFSIEKGSKSEKIKESYREWCKEKGQFP